MSFAFRHFTLSILVTGLVMVTAALAQASERDRLNAFLTVTGFDVALESIKLSADAAPNMIGVQSDDFGSEWKRMVKEVFDTSLMHDQALEILEQTLEEPLLDHAVHFYTSDLGARLVVAENASHLTEDDALKTEQGQSIVAGLVRAGSPRLEELKRLNAASGSADASVHAIQEVQVRFLMAAAGAGVIELSMDEEDLRQTLKSQEGELRRGMQTSGLTGAAYTYQAFSDEEVGLYADALEHPMMQKVYALMNAVQFEIMADRFEAMAARMQGLQPSQEL